MKGITAEKNGQKKEAPVRAMVWSVHMPHWLSASHWPAWLASVVNYNTYRGDERDDRNATTNRALARLVISCQVKSRN